MKKLLLPILFLFSLGSGAQLKKLAKVLPVYQGPYSYKSPVFGMQSDASALSVLFLRNHEDISIIQGPDTLRHKFTFQISEWKSNQWDSITSIEILSKNSQTGPLHGSYRYSKGRYYFQLYHYIQNKDSVAGLARGKYSTLCFTPTVGWSSLIPPLTTTQNLEQYLPDPLLKNPGFEVKGDTVYMLEAIRQGTSAYVHSTLFRYYHNTWDTVMIPGYADSAWANLGQLYYDKQDVFYLHSGIQGMHKITGTSVQAVNVPKLANTLFLSEGSTTVIRIQMNFRSFGKFGSEILLTDDSNGVSIYDGSTLQKTNNSNSLYLRDFVKFKGKYYAVAAESRNVYGNPLRYKKLLRLEGLNWVEISIPFDEQDQALFLTEHQGRLYIGGRFNVDTSDNVALLSDNLATVSGYVYRDLNSNCGRDSAEPTYSNTVIRFTPGNYLVNTDENGKYYIIMEQGAYRASLITKKWFNAVCYAAGDSFNLASDINYADISQLKPSVSDMRVTLSSASGKVARRGANISYQIFLENTGNMSLYGSLTLRFDKRLNNWQSPSSFQKINDSTYTLNIDSLQPDASRRINFTLYTDPTQLIVGDKIRLSVIINPAADSDTSDNKDTLRQSIIAAYDPNHKQCEPSGKITHQLKHIDYHIQFQNLGLDTAIRVRVVDSFDTRLALHKAVITGYSHPYKVDIRNNVITWTFDKIMLTPDRVNYDGSHGYVAFRVFLHGSLNVGDSIRNKAQIYFDYEDAVITNYASVALVQDTTTINIPPHKPLKHKNIHVYPNPGNGIINVEFPEFGPHTLTCYDLLGRELITLTYTGEGVMSFDISHLASGLYTLRDEHGYTSTILIQH